MKSFVIYLFLSVTSVFNGLATNSILISNTSSSLVDGWYELLSEGYYQKTNSTMKIVKMDKTWAIIDSQNNEYYAVYGNYSMPPTKGWDIGRAGIGLNPALKLEYNDQLIEILLKNNTNFKQNIGVKFKDANGKEQVRQFDILANDVKKYSVAQDTEIIIFTSEETNLLMNKTKEIINGRLLLKVTNQDANRIINIF